MVELMAKAEDRTPYTVVALQEADRMNGLTNEMKISLKELDLGLKVRFKILLQGFYLYKYSDRKFLSHRKSLRTSNPQFSTLTNFTENPCFMVTVEAKLF